MGKFRLFFVVLLLLGLVICVELVVGYGVDEVVVMDGFLFNLWVKGLIFVKVYCLIIVFFVMFLGGFLFYFF